MADKRDLQDLFKNHAGTEGILTEASLLSALRELDIHPSRLQVREMIQSCQDTLSEDGVPYVAFCIFVQEFFKGKSVQWQPPRSKTRQRTDSFYNTKNQETVFLGGSCNPTTWRHDLAIPFFSEQSIQFYNPQVIDWRQELVEIENAAKKDAELLFFVININETRSASSMIEAAYLAGCDRQLILVMSHFKGRDLEVRGEKITESEFVELRRSQEVVVKNVELMKIPVFRDIEKGLHCAAKVIKEKLRVQDLRLGDGARPLSSPHVMVAQSLLEYKEVFDSYSKNGGEVKGADIKVAYKEVKGHEPSPGDVDADSYTFAHFCDLCVRHSVKKASFLDKFLQAVCKTVSGVFQSSSKVTQPNLLYLGGCRYDSSTWRQAIAIPMLKENNISYVLPPDVTGNPEVGVVNADRTQRDNCSLLLYVINAATRGLATMCQVAFFIGLGCKMVLCVQNMHDNAVVGGEQLSTQAVSDYNRGRVYLSDLAAREDIPMFDDIALAVDCAIRLMKEQQSGAR